MILLFQLNGHAPTNIQNKCECIFKKDQQQNLNAVRKILSEKTLKQSDTKLILLDMVPTSSPLNKDHD